METLCAISKKRMEKRGGKSIPGPVSDTEGQAELPPLCWHGRVEDLPFE